MNGRLVTIVACVVVAVLLGAGGILLGQRVTAPRVAADPAQTAPAAPAAQTVSVPVLGSVGRGELPPLLDGVDIRDLEPAAERWPQRSGGADGDESSPAPEDSSPTGHPSGLVVSPVIGAIELPADADGQPDLGEGLLSDAEVRGGAEADGDPWGLGLLEGESEGVDDACAPAVGEPDEACPEGLTGAIFASRSIDLWLYGSDSVHEPSDELPPYAVQCPAVETSSGSLPFGFAASAPGTVEMTYGPHGGSSTQTLRLTSTQEQVADWEARLAATPADAVWTPAVYFCTTLSELDKQITYEFDATITDDHGTTATSTGWFRLPEDRVRPPAQIVPIGDGVLYTALAHKPGDTVHITYHVLDDGRSPDCAAPSDDLPAPLGRRTAVAVTPLTEDYLADNGYLPGYTERTSWITTVPEGSTVLVCFSEFKQTRPTWQWLDAQWRTWAVVATPDYARPAVIADAVSLVGDVDPNAIDVSITWGTGSCSLVNGPARRGSSLELREDRSACDGGKYAPTQVDPVVHVSVRHDGETYRSSSVLPLSRLGRTGGGAVPETAWFGVPLTVDVDEVEMCGSGLRAPCSRIEGYGTAGTVMLRVDWTEGASNGRADWHVGDLTSERVEHELEPLPQVDFLQHDWEVVDVAPRGGPVTVRYVLATDRPVDYEVTLTGTCAVEGEDMTRSGSTRGQVALTWRACAGESYHLTGVLTGEDGATAVYGSGDTWAVYSTLTTPRYDTRLAVAFRAEHTATGDWEGPNTLLAALRLRVDGQRIDLGLDGRDCLSRPVLDRSAGIGLREVGLSQDVRVEVTVLMVEAWGSSGGGEPPACTGATTVGVPTVDLVADVSLDDLLTGTTITWSGDTEYDVTLTLQDYGPAS